MAVGAQEGGAGPSEAFQVNLVTDAVPGPGIIYAVTGIHGLKVLVVIGIFEAHLQRIVVHVGYGNLRPHPRYPHGFELQIGHGTRGILCQRLIDTDSYLISRFHFPFNQVILQNLVCYAGAHIFLPDSTSIPFIRPAVNDRFDNVASIFLKSRAPFTDNDHMNISGGLSEISFGNAQSGAVQRSKVYLWPTYHEGRVDPVKNVLHRTEGNVYYTKASDEERETIINQYKNNQQLAYKPDGKFTASDFYTKPGTLFDALV
jgi:hypothetical protein